MEDSQFGAMFGSGFRPACSVETNPMKTIVSYTVVAYLLFCPRAVEAQGTVLAETRSVDEDCWETRLSELPLSWPFDHLYSPLNVPKYIKLISEHTYEPDNSTSFVPGGASIVEVPETYSGLAFRYWIRRDSLVVVSSSMAVGYRIEAVPSEVDLLIGTFTSYAHGDFLPRPEPQDWSEEIRLTRISCSLIPNWKHWPPSSRGSQNDETDQ